MNRKETGLKNNSETKGRSAFEKFRKSHAPIDHVFAPKNEVQKILTLPSRERREATKRFKEQLAVQQEAWSACRLEIESHLEKNPDIDWKEAQAIFEPYFKTYGFDDEQVAIAHDILYDYAELRSNVKELYSSHHDSAELATLLTGIEVPSNEDIEVKLGLVSIDITVTDPVIAKKMYDGSEDSKEPLDYGGFATRAFIDGNEIPFSVILKQDYPVERVKKHESQHQTNSIFRRYFDQYVAIGEQKYMLKAYESSNTPTEKRIYLESYFTERSKAALDRAKDEVFAYAKDGTDAKTTFATLTNKKNKAYDYLGDLRMMKPDDPVWLDVSSQILVTEYERTLKQGIDAFNQLAKLRSVPEAIALLTPEPLSTWSRFVTRNYAAQTGKSDKSRQELTEAVIAKTNEIERRERLVQKLKTSAPTLAAGAVLAAEVGYIGAEAVPQARRIHENRENVQLLETAAAQYEIVYTSAALPVSAETIAHPDGILLSKEYVYTADAAVNAVQAEEFRTEKINPVDAELMRAYGIDPAHVAPHYRSLFRKAFEKKIPLYFIDSDDAGEKQSETTSAVLTGAESSAGLAITALGIKDLQQPTRRKLFKGIGKVLFGSYLTGTGYDVLKNSIEPYEPNTEVKRRDLDRVVLETNRKIHPELQLPDGIQTHDALIAQKSETVAKWLENKLGKKPHLVLVLDKKHLGVERQLKTPEEERLLALRRDLGPRLWDESNIIKVTNKHGHLQGQEFIDETLTS